MASYSVHAAYYRDGFDRPYPSLPSPTLTNPDMVLPDDLPTNRTSLSSPTSNTWRERPPSPSYLRDRRNQPARGRAVSGSSGGSSSSRTVMAEDDRRGLMSRKINRPATPSDRGPSQPAAIGNPPSISSASSRGSAEDREPRQEAGKQNHTAATTTTATTTTITTSSSSSSALEELVRSSTASSFDSDDMVGMPEFLARFKRDAATPDRELDGESTAAPQTYGFALTTDSEIEAQRRQQQEDEQTSLFLSKRAELILANAKKRLNLMEGNLRGARDLVAPLTTANLKRATSLGSSHHTSSSYGGRGRYTTDTHRHKSQNQPATRALHAQASSPTMGRDYHAGHWRGSSDTRLPERPFDAHDRTDSPIRAVHRIPTKASDPSWTNALKGSKSYESLPGVIARHGAAREPSYPRGSLDSNLAPVAEDDISVGPDTPREGSFTSSEYGDSEPLRSSSRTDSLREQMSSLKGKISTLKERAREDSLRRQTMQQMRDPSPLNNATINAPEFFYTPSDGPGSPVLDSKAVVGSRKSSSSPTKAKAEDRSDSQTWHVPQAVTGSRNAFAEQAAAERRQQQQQHLRHREGAGTRPGSSSDVGQLENEPLSPDVGSPAGSPSEISDREGTAPDSALSVPSPNENDETYTADQALWSSEGQIGTASTAPDDAGPRPGSQASQQSVSVYEDAPSERPPSVPHEDREDAFDYKAFFLHGAMSIYGKGYPAKSEGSVSSEESVTSVETAKGPTAPIDDKDDEYDGEEEDDDDDDDYHSNSDDDDDDDDNHEFDLDERLLDDDTSETSERLREIARSLRRRRKASNDSISTVATFATADEDNEIPPPKLPSKRASGLDWPIPPSTNTSRPTSPRNYSRPTTSHSVSTSHTFAQQQKKQQQQQQQQQQRSQTAVAIKQRPTLSDSSSERADSGVGMPNHQGPATVIRVLPISNSMPRLVSTGVGTSPMSPPMSPSALAPSSHQDPVAAAANALLDPSGARPLAQEHKALLLSVLDGVRKTMLQLQLHEGGESPQFNAQGLRARLEDAKKLLDGSPGTERPSTS